MKHLLLIAVSLLLINACKQAGNDSSEKSGADSLNTEAIEGEEAAKKSPAREVSGTIGGANIKVRYSSPAVKERIVWGDLVPYGKVWRTGADEATVIEFDKDMLVQGKKIPAGKYALFTIPRESGDWTVIFNKVWDQWGAYNYDEAEDALRVEVKVLDLETPMENLRFDIGTEDRIILSWEKLMIPIEVKGI